MPITPLNHQKEALEELTVRAKAYYAGRWKNLPIRPRWHSLVCGPTGVGKSALAKIVAQATDASLLLVSATGWVPAGAHQRSTRETVLVIAEHVVRNDRTLFVIDEMDKLVEPGPSSTSGGDTWRSYVRGEIYDLTDGRWPAGMRPPDDEQFEEVPLDVLTTKLRDSVFVVGIGTFQSWYDHAAVQRSMGFDAEIHPLRKPISAEVVAERIPRELANRFNSDLIKIPDLELADYRQIAFETERKLPLDLRQAFRSEVGKRIEGAVVARKGVRFLEECMMQVLKQASMPQIHPGDPDPV